MVVWKFKSCPRCGGDIFIDRDMEGWYKHCLQCSYARELEADWTGSLVEKKQPVLVLKEVKDYA